MSPQLIGGLVDAAIPLLAGLFATAYGLGFVGGDKTSAHTSKKVLGVLGPLLVAFGCLQIGLALMRAPETDLEGRAMFVAAANSRAGEQVDDETRLVSVTDEGTHIQFDYKLFRVKKAQVDARGLEEAMSGSMVTYLCDNATANQALTAWGPFQMRYVDAEEALVTALSMTAADCP